MNPKPLWGDLYWYAISAQTYLDLREADGLADNLPIRRLPDAFPELASVRVPILATYGANDDCLVSTPERDLQVLRSRATAAERFDALVIPGAPHGYDPGCPSG